MGKWDFVQNGCMSNNDDRIVDNCKKAPIMGNVERLKQQIIFIRSVIK